MELLRPSPFTSILANPTLSYPFRLIPSKKGRNLSIFFLRKSALKSYAVSRNVRLSVSASLPRRSRRNNLREKLLAREVQVLDIPKSPTIDRDTTQTGTDDTRGSHDSDLPVKEAVESSSSQVGEAEENAINSMERSDLARESALRDELKNWQEQYKKDSELWGIGSGPIFIIHRDSLGAITKVAVDEDEIVRRSQMGTLSHPQGDKQDLDVIEKITRAKIMAKGILSGELILPNNSSVVRFEDTKYSLVHKFQSVIPQGKTLLNSSPRIAFTLLCGYMLFWSVKNIWGVGGSSSQPTSEEEEEMLRRKLKARKEVIACDNGSIEVIQNEEQDQVPSIRMPTLDKDKLVKEISRSKTDVSTRPKLPKFSNTKDPSFENRIKEIREMARKARDSERQDGKIKSQDETAKTDGGLNSVFDTLTNESGGRQWTEVDLEDDGSSSQKLSSPGEDSGNQFVSQKPSSSSTSPTGMKHTLIRSVKEAREYLSRKNKIQQDGLLSPIDDNGSCKGGYGTDKSNLSGKTNRKTGETIASVEIPEVDIPRGITTPNLASEFCSMGSKTKIGVSIMDEGVTNNNHSHRTQDIRSSVLRNSHKSMAATSINGSGNKSSEGNHSNREMIISRIEAAGVENVNESLTEESISQESACIKNDEPEQREMKSNSFQVDSKVSDATSVTAINGKRKSQLNGVNSVLSSLDFLVPPIPMKKHVTEKEGANGVPYPISLDPVKLSEEPSSTSDNTSANMKNERELVSERETDKEFIGVNPPEDSKSSSKNNWSEDNFQEFEPIVKKIQHDGLLSSIDNNGGSKGGYGTDESDPSGKANQKTGETIGSVEISEVDIPRCTTSQTLASESYPMDFETKVGESLMDDGVTKDNHSHRTQDIRSLSEESFSTSDSTSTNMKNRRELVSDGELDKEFNGANPPKDSKSSSRNNRIEENFQEFEPLVKKIHSGFRENYLTAQANAKENTFAKTDIRELDLFNDDDELEWMKDEKLKEIVFQVRENELAGRNPFHLINDEDRAAFFNGLETKADKLKIKLLELHEWIHSRIENIDYGLDGISLYDPPEKIMPRWKGPAVDWHPEVLKKSANGSELCKGSCDTTDKPKDSEEHLDGVSPYTSSLAIRNKNENNVTSRQRTVIECSDGTSKPGKKGANEQWQHTKKWSQEFLEIYNSESDPEIKAIMKDMGQDLDRWVTKKDVQEVADLMSIIPAKKRQYIEKKLSKIENEIDLFGLQAVASKYKEYSDKMEEDYLWWLDLKVVLFIELYMVENNVPKIGFYSLEMAPDLELDPKQHHVIGFEDPGDSKNFCYIIQAHLDVLGKGSAFVVARHPKDAFREAKGNGFNVTVIRKGQLKLHIGQPLEEVEEEITEIGSEMYHHKIMNERGIDMHALVKGAFASESSKG